jgi:amino acid transporter
MATSEIQEKADAPHRESGNQANSSEVNEDEARLSKLGYYQELKRIFGPYTNFCLTSSMVSTLLGIIPLYPFEIRSGGPVVMFWSWLIIGGLAILLGLSLAEIASTYPTMGALYYWSYRLGGPEWGPFSSWLAGWTNLLGQIAGVSSGSYSGALITVEIIHLISGFHVNKLGVMGLNIIILVLAGIVNSFAETLLTTISYISAVWQILGVIVIVVWMLIVNREHLQSASFVFLEDGYNNYTGFDSIPLVVLIGSLAAATTFTGYDTAAHIAEETTVSHISTPMSMMFSILNVWVLGLILIVGMNFCISDIAALSSKNDDDSVGQGRCQNLTIQHNILK